MKALINIIAIGLLTGILSCNSPTSESGKTGKIKVVTTTTMVTDLLNEIGGESVVVNGLMGAGVDPHLYKASEGDVHKFYEADVIFYNGLHLEGKLVEIFEKMQRNGKKTIAVADAIDKANLISSDYFDSSYDPHIWFDIGMWEKIAVFVAEKLSEIDPDNGAQYQENLAAYLEKLNSASQTIQNKIDQLPKEKRILITAHDAFSYFGKTYGFKVMGLQGISTATEAGVKDVQKLAGVIVENEIRAIFVESSVPKRNIEALQEATRSKGFDVEVGGELYSDALGSPGTPQGNYIGMMLHNVNTIVDALKE